jgi:carboxymethylenebutenolidase
MGEMIQLSAADGHQLSAYEAAPAGTPRAGILILQEIFGVTAHIKRVTDAYASRGYLALAPAFFDRVGPNITLDYADIEQGRDTMMQLDPDNTVKDMAAAVEHLGSAGAVATVGYCWGGAMAYLAACRLPLAAAVSYYGGQIARFLDEAPQCPVMYHFGAEDGHIPMSVVDEIKAARTDGIFHIYAGAGHGFNCDDRADYHPNSAALALQRSLDFLAQHL